MTVSYGPDILARQLAFGVATSYATVSPGVQTVQFTASGAHTAMPVQLAADTVHTIVVLDDPSGLKIDALMDAAGSQTMPKGGSLDRPGRNGVKPGRRSRAVAADDGGRCAAGRGGLRRPAPLRAAPQPRAINCEAGDSHAAAKPDNMHT